MNNFNKAKWFALIVFIIFVAALILIAVYNKVFFQKYSDLIGTLSTLSFIYLTYETLRQTRQSETSPYVTVKLILASRLDEDFIKNNRGLIIDGQIKRLLDDFKKEEPPKKDLVFVQVENIGELTAVEVKIELEYSKKTYDRTSNQTITITFGTLKKDESVAQLIDFFDVPTKEDFFKVNKCITFLNTANRKYVSDGLKKKNVSESITYNNFGDSTTVVFKK